MLTVLARLINPRKRRDAPIVLRAAKQSRGFVPDDAERSVARSLAESLDEALAHNHEHRLSVLSEASLRIAHRHPHLTERLARLRMNANDADGALALIDAVTELPSSLRLLRCACLLQAGRRAEAHQDLSKWCTYSAAHIDARVMAALLDWEAGDVKSANALLRENLRQLGNLDVRTLMAALCLAVHENNADRVATLVEQLRQCTAGRTCTPDIEVLMGSLGVTAPAPTTHLSDPQLDAFVTEIIAAEQTLPALVESLEIKPDTAICAMLIDALDRALPDLSNASAGIEVLARLHLLQGQRDAAAALVQRGLESNPMSAALVLLHHELEQRAAVTPTPADIRHAQRTIETRDPHRSKAA